MQKQTLKNWLNTTSENVCNRFNKIRKSNTTHEVLQGLKLGLLIATITLTAGFILIKSLSFIFDYLYRFFNQHFFGCASLTTGVAYVIYQHNKKKEARAQVAADMQKGVDAQRERFCKGCYLTIGNWLYSGILSAPNFSALTSCQRPLRPADIGNAELDAYTFHGIMYHRFTIPKIDTENIDTALIKSAIQGLIDQHIRTGGLPPLIERSENNKLYVDKVEDMKTTVVLTLVLTFDDSYIQRVAYDNAMTEVLNRTYGNRTLEDSDYHG
ncbi:hypothetical protein [Hungatella sp.]|uniref:hypothetical protein n=1 Tax=Hungatella sp. TaxID=2613924 RepID=UPI002A7FC29F|nr:hypothetical protein [Hungatella sp.]